MPLSRSIVLLAVLSLVTVSPAEAFRLTNRDTTEQKMTIQENNGAREQVLKPAESLDGVCNSGCTIKMHDGEEYEFDGNEVVSIEEGLIFLDDPAPGSAETQKQ